MASLQREASVQLQFEVGQSTEKVFDFLTRKGIDPGDHLLAVQGLPGHLWDITFKSVELRRKFWPVISDGECCSASVYTESTTLVTVLHVPHELDDNVVRYVLGRYGRVISGRFLMFKDYPTVFNGIRQYKMKLNSDIPSSVSFGGRSCWVRYRGQPRTCLKCGEAGHDAKECGVIRCFNCQSLGHASKECEVPTTCTICGKSGHHYRDCPVSFANKYKPNSSWIIGSHAKTSEGGEKEAEANLGEEVVEVSSDDATHSAIASNPGPSFMADSQPPNEVVSDKQTNDSQILLFEDSEPVVIPDTQASSDVVTDKKSSESEMDISDGRPEIKTLDNCIPQPQLQDNETCSNEIQSQPAMSVDKDPIFVKPRRKASSQHDTGRRPERSPVILLRGRGYSPK
ncbi:Zinc finger CCHC domain-containing protein 3 [Holothuria leucospilota]|uniref:Zinc finger CCHC domain-containing protein 3 n=1 Tax=Holothuria leucospilota TaxID=206669 RepID=A0A9Q1BBC9_HOLLE|nr:Zinc finger CCHC domain-containing protein 3 [Holothuria leucospilota]